MAEELNLDCEIYSFHSISKGIYGECGLRGGYMEISTKIDKEVHDEIHKTKSIYIIYIQRHIDLSKHYWIDYDRTDGHTT